MIGKQPITTGLQRFFQKHLRPEFPKGLNWDHEDIQMLMTAAAEPFLLTKAKGARGLQKHYLRVSGTYPEFVSKFMGDARAAMENFKSDWSVITNWARHKDIQLAVRFRLTSESIKKTRQRLVKEDEKDPREQRNNKIRSIREKITKLLKAKGLEVWENELTRLIIVAMDEHPNMNDSALATRVFEQAKRSSFCGKII